MSTPTYMLHEIGAWVEEPYIDEYGQIQRRRFPREQYISENYGVDMTVAALAEDLRKTNAMECDCLEKLKMIA